MKLVPCPWLSRYSKVVSVTDLPTCVLSRSARNAGASTSYATAPPAGTRHKERPSTSSSLPVIRQIMAAVYQKPDAFMEPGSSPKPISGNKEPCLDLTTSPAPAVTDRTIGPHFLWRR